MKKLILLVTLIIFALTITVNAANVELKDAGADIISVNGAANEGELISIMILNPGFTEADIITSSAEAIQFYGRATGKSDNTYTLDVGMKNLSDAAGGKYTLLVSKLVSDAVEKTNFEFYFYDKKIEVIRDLNDKTVAMENKISEAYTVYSLGDSDLFTETSNKEIANVLSGMGTFAENVDLMYQTLQKALTIAAFNEGAPSLVSGGELLYADIIGVNGTDIHNDYKSALSSVGKTAVNTNIMKKDYKKVEDIAAEFKELVLVNLVTNYGKALGYGHIAGYFDNYKSDYIALGLNVNKLTNITNKNYVYNALNNAKSAKTMSELNSVYEKALLEADESQDINNGPSGTGSSSSAGAGNSGSVSTSGVSAGSGLITNVDAISLPFNDVGSVSWAKEAIAELYKLGVINGKDSSTFAPNDTVTREEFTKMVVVAFLGEPQSAECDFTDVAGWAVPYIAQAAKNNIISGTGDGLFNPKGNITREQAAAIIVRALANKGFASEKESDKFSDSSNISEWAKESIDILSAEGVLNGKGDNKFYPKDNMTRAEAAKVLYYSLKLMGGATK